MGSHNNDCVWCVCVYVASSVCGKYKYVRAQVCACGVVCV